MKVLLIVTLFGVGSIFLWVSTLKIPDLGSFDQRIVEQSTKIYDRSGEILLFDVHQGVRRTIVGFDNISLHIKNATVAIEDAEFYEHKGIKLDAITRAILVNIGARGYAQGGSTLTQQVVKNSILTSEKRISRKLKEWVLSLKLEQELSKEQILEVYLNESPYGGNIYGVEEASKTFFNKKASDLTLAEAAYLAALPQAPTYYSPYGNHRDDLEDRKNLVLQRMKELGFISQEEHKEAVKEEVIFAPAQKEGIRAPHFVFYIQEYLENKYGKRAVEERGFSIVTTLDAELQALAERVVADYAQINEENFNAQNAGLVAIDPSTGQILAMVGSRNYFDEKIDGNFNVTLAKRQPGSAFKPFAYAQAFSNGFTPETVVFDARTQFSTYCSPSNFSSEGNCYTPKNYLGTFSGPISLRSALAQSINIASIKTLYLAGLVNTLNLAKAMGITTLSDANRYGLTLVLGGGEVTLLDMTSAYGVLANDGVRNPVSGILSIEDSGGKVVEAYSLRATRVLDENVARMITDILSDNEARAPVFGSFSNMHIPLFQVAAKTGTTNDFRDAWIVGYTPSLSVGVWAGNNDNSPMANKAAVTIAGPIWKDFMTRVLSDRGQGAIFNQPTSISSELKPVLQGVWEGSEIYIVDSISGKLATEYTPIETQEIRVVPDVHTILHWVDKNNPRGAPPTNPGKDSQYEYWEYGIAKWLENNPIREVSVPTEFDDLHTPESIPKISILSPSAGLSYPKSSEVNVRISNQSQFPLTKIDVFVNGEFAGSSTTAPFSFTFTPSKIDSVSQSNILTVVAYDGISNRVEQSVIFNTSP
jgi:1A family penicillin-binding protein